MDRTSAITVLHDWDRQGRYVFTLHDLAKLFPGDRRKALQAAVNRLVRDGLLVRACRGIYVNPLAGSRDRRTIEEVAKALRRGEHSYVSLESALSEYGVISQVPVDRLTVMTTGRKGLIRTPWGAVEFTHTSRAPSEITMGTRQVDRPLRLATAKTALRDLKRVGRNLHLVDEEEALEDV
jgi:hypothetical protein